MTSKDEIALLNTKLRVAEGARDMYKKLAEDNAAKFKLYLHELRECRRKLTVACQLGEALEQLGASNE